VTVEPAAVEGVWPALCEASAKLFPPGEATVLKGVLLQPQICVGSCQPHFAWHSVPSRTAQSELKKSEPIQPVLSLTARKELCLMLVFCAWLVWPLTVTWRARLSALL
jgi:hypothetical protein